MKHYRPATTSHVLHFILTILFFPWIIVWIACAASTSRQNKQMEFMMMQQGYQNNHQNRRD